MSDIERELEEALHRVLDPISARPIPARRPLESRSAFRTVAGGAGAALTVKLLTGIAAAAAAVTVAGAVTTGSLNPVNWGEAVTNQVQLCKDKIANSGQHGIGECVSDLANTHGATVSSDARHHGKPNGTNNGNGNGNGNGNSGSNGNNGGGNGRGKSTSHPTPPPRSVH
ncbi:MAG TPA: hypothetical protein VGT01_04650 [Candidatus Dormibacteraeota bacterium]|nr:hypothetical protein [Candidatus Dormibacteraeota bacterium]HEV2476155.1 hypothetical protein [Candidatus Dormibacteraeota bacterium]